MRSYQVVCTHAYQGLHCFLHKLAHHLIATFFKHLQKSSHPAIGIFHPLVTMHTRSLCYNLDLEYKSLCIHINSSKAARGKLKNACYQAPEQLLYKEISLWFYTFLSKKKYLHDQLPFALNLALIYTTTSRSIDWAPYYQITKKGSNLFYFTLVYFLANLSSIFTQLLLHIHSCLSSPSKIHK